MKYNNAILWKKIGVVRFFTRLPHTSPGKNWRKIAERLNVWLFSPINRRRLRAFHNDLADVESGRFYLIAVPRTLPYLIPCLQLIENHAEIVIIDNGLEPWETACVARYFPKIPVLRLSRVFGSVHSHGRVLNLLFAANDRSFAILDHDTFVFDKDLLQDPRLSDNEFLAACWFYRNEQAGALVPRTHFVYFNTPIIKTVMGRYRVGLQVYQTLPARLWNTVGRVGFSPDNFPKDYCTGFDATNLVTALCLADGLKARRLHSEHGQAVHVGGTSHKQDGTQRYLNRRFLEFCDDPELFERHGYPHGGAKHSEQLPSDLSAAEAKLLGAWTDKLLARLRAHISAETAPG